jgi:hypothetical protein
MFGRSATVSVTNAATNSGKMMNKRFIRVLRFLFFADAYGLRLSQTLSDTKRGGEKLL